MSAKRTTKAKRKRTKRPTNGACPPYINPKLAVLARPLKGLHEDDANARAHDDRNLEAIRASLAGFRQQKPIVVTKGGKIVAGNGTFRAAQILGWDSIAAVEFDGTAKQAAAYGIADNRTAELAEWDDANLAALLDSLDDDLAGLTGFAEEEIAALLRDAKGPPAGGPNDVPEPPKKAITKPGDLWVLGEHRLLCGDATDADDVGRLLDGATPFICVTDPPYGVNYDPAWRTRAAEEGHLAYADRRIGEVKNDDRADWKAAWDLFPGDVLYSWCPASAPNLVHTAAIEAAGFSLRIQIIWAKNNFPIGRGDYHVRHEPCWYAVRKGRKSRRTKDRTQTTLWEINLDKNVEGGHSTQKPVECMARPIRNHDAPGGLVYDPFLGSGTTLIACEQLDRRCLGLEIEPRYCDVIVARWEQFTGGKAERA